MNLDGLYDKITGLVALELFGYGASQDNLENEFTEEFLYLNNISTHVFSKETPETMFEILRIYDVYFRNGSPLISDNLYDGLHKIYEESHDEPTTPIMFEPSLDAWEKVEHEIPMGSLDKQTSVDEIEKWNCKKNISGYESVVSEKLDGISCMHRDVELETDIGVKTIGEIVDNELKLKVKSFDHKTGKVEFKNILAYQRLKNYDGKNWVKVKAKNSKGEIVELITTNDHYWYSVDTNDYKMIREFTSGDKILYSK